VLADAAAGARATRPPELRGGVSGPTGSRKVHTTRRRPQRRAANVARRAVTAIEAAYLAAHDNAARRRVLLDAMPGLTHERAMSVARFAATHAPTVSDRADAEVLRLFAFAISPGHYSGWTPSPVPDLDLPAKYDWLTAVGPIASVRSPPHALARLAQRLALCWDAAG